MRAPQGTFAFALVAILTLTAALAQQPRGGPRVARFVSSIDGSEQEYALYLPRTYDAARKYPLLVSLHPEDSNHIAELKRVFAVPARFGESPVQNLMTLPVLPDVDFVVACPFARGNMAYQGIAEQEVYDMLADVKRNYSIDEDRVYVTGSSMGGGAALWMALTTPDIWAAAAPLCAAVPPGAEELAGNALNLPIRLFQGDQDPLIPVASSRQWQKRLLDAGVPVEYVEYPGARHNVWDYAYKGGQLFQWLGERKRNRNPDHVRFASSTYRYRRAYWVQLDSLTPGVTAHIDAIRKDGDIAVTTSDLGGFSLTGTARTVTVDGAAVRLRPGAALSFVKSGARWTQGKSPVEGKRPGVEGPIVDAVRSRHIWVYGTESGGQDEVDRRRALAEAASSWSSTRVRVNVGPVVKADRDVTPEEIAGANLILFGTRDSNTLIRRFAAQLPFELNPGAADYGTLLIAPNSGRYIVVASGLPWWTGADEANRGGYQFAPEQYRLLSTFGDYIVFKGGVQHVLAEGRFDRNWKLAAEDAAKLRASGVVTLRP